MWAQKFLLLLSLAFLCHAAFRPDGSTNWYKLARRGPPLESSTDVKAHQEKYFTQKLDHFDILNTQTWQQRYFISDANYTAGAPVFLFLSGEWEARASQVEDTFVGQMAATFGAFTIDLEHRFYGKSRPLRDLQTPSLKYLNVNQALEDAAAFALAIKSELNLDGPWIVIGGSYSANMAAWARAKYPHLFYAAWASSGPVLAKVDFAEYQEVVNEALNATDPVCQSTVAAAMAELDSLVAGGSFGSIVQLFNICGGDLGVERDLQNLYYTISQIFAGWVQYNRFGSLKAECDKIVAGQDTPLQTLAEVVGESLGGLCLDVDVSAAYQHYIENVDYSDDITRQWIYQSCVEFGYFQTLASSNQPFGQSVQIDALVEFCNVVYGPEFTYDIVQAGVDKTNLEHGGLTPDVSRVLYTHGTLDPWHALGLQTALTADSPVIMIDGQSHCRDIGTPSAEDPPELVAARQQIEQVLASWFSG